MHALFFNGLGGGRTRKRERLAMHYLAKRDIQVEHIQIDWWTDEPFEMLLERVTAVVRERLKQHGILVLIGSSAGGSLALNVFKKVNDEDLSVVTLCSRLREVELSWWDRRTLRRMAYLGTPKASQAFYDSVIYCTNKTVELLTPADKQRITIIRQLADDVVPRQTMEIEGVKSHKAKAFGHGWGIAEAVRKLPEWLDNKASV